MNLRNITLKTAELGPVEWENVEKLQPSESGFICFISYEQVIKFDEEGNETTHLIGTYIQTDFNYAPTYKEMINFIVSKEYPNGKEQQLLRHGINNPEDEEYVEYYSNVEDITQTIKSILS